MPKPSPLKVWTYTFCIVPVAVVAAALLVVSPARHASTASAAPGVSSAARGSIQASYAALPLAFEPNQGQMDSHVQYFARGNGYALFLTGNDAVFSLRSPQASAKNHAAGRAAQKLAQKDSTAVVRMQLVGSDSLAKVSASDQLSGTSNYYLGNDPAKWRSGIPRFARVSYENIYPGVNLAYYGAQRQLEFDFVVAPHANPAPISLLFSGNQYIKTDASGNLVISTAAGDVLLHKPVAYQEQNGARQSVDARFALNASNQISFELGNYDRSRELVIDPTTVSYAFSTFLGGSQEDDGFGIAFDANGNSYVTGKTASTDFDKTNSNAGGFDVFVAKIASDGSSLLYATFVGGSKDDSGAAIAVDPTTGEAFVAGGTESSNFPTTSGAFQAKLGTGATSNAFVFKLASSGSLSYCAYLGGSSSDAAFGVAVDSSGNAYAVGETDSSDFPPKNPIQAKLLGVDNAFVTKLNSSGSALLYSTYLGGSVTDSAQSVAVDSSGNAYVTGSTLSGDFPVNPKPGAFQTTCSSCTSSLPDAFVTVINAAGSGYVYSTFLGGSGADVGTGIAVDSLGDAFVAGSTESANFPTHSAFQSG